MILGLKVNADRESHDRLVKSNTSFVEIWFNVNDKDRYIPLFEELDHRNCAAGLHFWGMLDGNISPNIAYPDSAIAKQSMDLMRQTIDVAAQRHCRYVNIHPGASALSRVNYKAERYDLISDPADLDTSINLFIEHALDLKAYAETKGVVFTVETVPPRITDGWYNDKARQNPKNVFELPVTAITQAYNANLWIANDFCHTAANVITDEPDRIYTFLKGTTQLLADKTRLIHLGFIMPPYNGTDNHDELDNPILQTNAAVPNTNQMIELLKLFKNRDDVWMLVEPKDHHVKNYFLAKKLLEESEKAISNP